uniref:Mitochondrial import receptor subunit TOM22 homolog n=1 Tax=Dicentrarchus labrax TaxID=13489 RepID=A0A8P4GHW8_DICLA
MAAIEELSPAVGPVSTRPPEDEIDDDEDEDLDETLMERLWGLTEMFPDTVRTAAEVSAQCSVSLAKRFYSFSRSALWVGTTSFMILVLPYEDKNVLYMTNILLGPNTGMSGGMPGMMPPAPGKM